LALAICGVVVRKTYFYVPIQELKRQAERHDPLASKLYPAAAYDGSLRFLLGLFIGLMSAGGLIMLARLTPIWLSLIIVLVILWAAFEFLPASRISSPGARLTVLVTPTITWILNYLHPILSRSARVVEKPYEKVQHTGIFEREDLVRLIDKQQKQSDNRLSHEELEIAKRALNFDERRVADIFTSRKSIKTVLASDTIGPILIDELHKSGQDFVVVRDKPKGPIVGTLQFSQLDIKTNGKIQDVMDATVYYVHEKDSLSEALHIFFETNQALFIVVNNSEDYVGVISVQNIIHELLGHVPGDDFDQYSDSKAVASRHHKSKKTAKTEEIEELVLE